MQNSFATGFPRPTPDKGGKYKKYSKIYYKDLYPATRPNIYVKSPWADYGSQSVQCMIYDPYTQQYVEARQDVNNYAMFYLTVYDKNLNLIKSLSYSSGAPQQIYIAFYRNGQFFISTNNNSQFGARMYIIADTGTLVKQLTTAGTAICNLMNYPIWYVGSSIRYFSMSDNNIYTFDFSQNEPTLFFTVPFNIGIASSGGYYSYVPDLEYHMFTDFSMYYGRVYDKNFNLVYTSGSTQIYTLKSGYKGTHYYHPDTDAIYYFDGSMGSTSWLSHNKMSKADFSIISSTNICQDNTNWDYTMTGGSWKNRPKYWPNSRKYYAWMGYFGAGKAFAFEVLPTGGLKNFDVQRQYTYLLNDNVEVLNYMEYPGKNSITAPFYWEEGLYATYVSITTGPKIYQDYFTIQN